jgi:hypothetical protein
MLWDLGVRDARPPVVQLNGGQARWVLDGAELNVSRRADVIVLSLSEPRVDLGLQPLVELVQVLDRLARASEA